ncbi:unnamed protein product [Ostreobium quekettii]|uniref:Fatty acyl-CoA reductase n=1 Tax=Ostreobium quekettii TaxID=121088 RepID=A0A8S1IRJ0_9CHLO|nr:unnamed protein product [Ostreobium quekettii]|eukprot:evm.model.scf_714EXC.4 EVM.evm.TU.scf_714EXC.4   scf_714EXC:33913-38197(+)
MSSILGAMRSYGSKEAAAGTAAPQAVSPPPGAARLSVRDAFRGSGVLLTGVTGYVGSIVMEQLLRVCPEVGRVYVLVRANRKKGVSAAERLDKLVNSGLFHKLWDKAETLQRVRLVEGDITVEGVGLEDRVVEELSQNVEYVVHSAAAVALDDPIKKTLLNNYMSTKNLLSLCETMRKLRVYVHISTAYVNITFPSGSVIKERIYPLYNGDQVASHEDIVSEILRLPPGHAESKAAAMMERWNFPNTYTFGKHLAEQLVADYHRKPFPVCIVRPSLISSLAGDPYPGYVGNLAGGAGFTIAFAIGFFEKYGAAYRADSIIDGVPGDIVSSVVLAAAASTATQPLNQDEPAIFHACTSCSYPLSNGEMYAAAQQFFNANPPPYCLQGSYPDLGRDYKPSPWLLWLAKSVTWLKVCSLKYTLQLLGKTRAATRLYTGWRAWDFANQLRYDLNLFFSPENVRKLDAMLVEEERELVRCLWTPRTGDWLRFMRTSMGAIKALFLKSPAKGDQEFRHIGPREPCVSYYSSALPTDEQLEELTKGVDGKTAPDGGKPPAARRPPSTGPVRRAHTGVRHTSSAQDSRPGAVRRSVTELRHAQSYNFPDESKGERVGKVVRRVSSRAMSDLAASLWGDDRRDADEGFESDSSSEEEGEVEFEDEGKVD